MTAEQTLQWMHTMLVMGEGEPDTIEGIIMVLEDYHNRGQEDDS